MKICSHERYADVGKANISKWKASENEKQKVKKYIALYESGTITGRLPTNPGALVERLLQMLRVVIENTAPTPDSTEQFKVNLIQGKILGFNRKTLKYNGKPYALKTKKGILETGRKYYEWAYPDKPAIAKPLAVKISIKENDDYEIFSIPNEADKLRANCGSIEKRGIHGFLMSGARIEELLNITEQDIKFSDTFTQITIKNNNSKTKGRTIKIYYVPASQDIYDFIQLRKSEGMKPNESVINWTYKGIIGFVATLGKTLNKKVTPHTYRHSVATFLSNKLNRHELCYYFGWGFSSESPNRYISRNGFSIKDADEKIKTDNIQDLKEQLNKNDFAHKLESESFKRELESLKESNAKLSELFKTVFNVQIE